MGKDIEETAKKTSTLSKAFNTLVPIGLSKALQSPAQAIVDLSKKSANFIEQLNVLDVAFRNNTDDIRKFTSTISETLNLDESTLISAASKFKTLANSMNIAEENGRDFSKMMTQLTLDTASLFNLDFNKAQSYLQNAALGRGTALKQQTGVSVLESTVQTNLEALGIDAYVKDMSDAEKAIARVISMSYQLRNAQGDLARTIEAPANQFRVLGEQVALAGRNIGNIFLPAVAAILPYINAALIVINKLLSAIAALFGFSENKWDFFGDSDAAIDTFEDIGTAIGGVGEAASSTAKKLQGLRAFDKLNNLTTPTASGGGSAGGGGGINPNLLKAMSDIFANYNTSLDNVKTKATEIAEAFMEWAKVLEPLKTPLKEISSLTYDGLVYVWKEVLKPLGSWIANSLIPEFAKTTAEFLELIYQIGLKLKPIYKFMYENIIQPFAKVMGKTVINILKDMAKFLDWIANNKFLTTLLAWGIALKSFKTTLGLVTKLLGKTAFGGAILNVANSIKQASGFQSKWISFLSATTPKLKSVEQEAKKLKRDLTDSEKLSIKFSNKLNAMKTAATGALTALAGFEILKSSFQDIAENGLSVGNVLSTLVGSITAVAGAVVALNAVFAAFGVTLMANPIFAIGAVILGVGVAIGTLVAGLFSASESTELVNETYKNFTETLEQTKQAEDDLIDSMNRDYELKLAEIADGQQYIDQLYELIDANGQVKQGYEDVARVLIDKINSTYGTQIELQDGVITNNGIILGNQEDMIRLADQYAEKLKKQMLLEQYQEYMKQVREDRLKLEQEFNKVLDAANKEYEEQGYISEETKKKVDDAYKSREKAVAKVKQAEDGLNEVTKEYANGTTESMKKVVDELTKSTKTTTEEAYNNYMKILDKQNKEQQKAKDNAIKNALDIKNTFEQQATPTLKIYSTFDSTGATNGYNNWLKRNQTTLNMSGLKPYTSPLQYAQGGLPSVGQMFIANERGPELIGQIGGQSFVANQNQMMDLLDKKIGNAHNSQGTQIYNIYLDEDHKIGSYTLEQLQGMAKSNGKPITITG